MYAIVDIAGQQFKVEAGKEIFVNRLAAAKDSSVEFDKVLMVANGESVQVGAPYVQGGKVLAEVVSHGRGDKIRIVKFRRRKHYRKQTGHRQWFTEVKITGISA